MSTPLPAPMKDLCFENKTDKHNYTSMKKTITLISAVAISIIGVAQNTYTLDKNHARLTFTALHAGISHIDGIFKIFDATFASTKEDFSDAEIEMTTITGKLNRTDFNIGGEPILTGVGYEIDLKANVEFIISWT
jgi:polyisoprenoid-binding protein YceI